MIFKLFFVKLRSRSFDIMFSHFTKRRNREPFLRQL